MKLILVLLAFCTSISLQAKEDGHKTVHTRGWIGGSYKLAKTHSHFPRRNIINIFPDSLRERQKAALFVEAIHSNTPAATAGLLEGDLILQVGETVTDSLKRFRSEIDEAVPGSSATLTVYRKGEILELPVVFGRESYEKGGTVIFGFFPISRCIDLFPNPDFSLLALGYSRSSARHELHAPKTNSAEVEYIRTTHAANHPGQPDNSAGKAHRQEVWQAWCLTFRLARHHILLSQEVFAPQEASAKPAGKLASPRQARALKEPLRGMNAVPASSASNRTAITLQAVRG